MPSASRAASWRLVRVIAVCLACFIAARPSAGQIVGGQPVGIEEVPWQIALRIRQGDRFKLCGGSIVDPQWVLTAAHCVPAGARPQDFQVITGTSDYLEGGRWVAVREVVVHSDYDLATNAADLALLRLAATLEGVAIPPAGPELALRRGEPLLVSGWGATAEGGGKSRQLLGATVPYVDNATCNTSESYAGRITPSMLCAGEVFGGADACQGDSGGPLVLRRDTGPVLVGVISFGVGCGRKAKYGVYTRVGAFRDWIERTIRPR